MNPDDAHTLPIPVPAPDPRRRRVGAGLAAGAVGAIGVVLLGVAAPAAHAVTASDAAVPRPVGAVRADTLPPAVPTPRGGGAAEAITDIWGRGSGAPPRSR